MWSIGVILFQSIYGKKVVWTIGAILIKPLSLSLQPFGHNLSQASILEQHTMLNAREVEFPVKPQVSVEAKVLLSVLGIFCGILKC